MNVTPFFLPANLTNKLSADTEKRGYLPLCKSFGSKGVNQWNIGLSQLAKAVLGPLDMGAMLQSIGQIVPVSVPTKICNMVVCWIAIVMATLHPNRTRAFKGGENQAMYLESRVGVIDTKIDVLVSGLVGVEFHRFAIRLSRPARFGLLKTIKRANVSVIGHFVKLLKAFHWQPNFHAYLLKVCPVYCTTEAGHTS